MIRRRVVFYCLKKGARCDILKAILLFFVAQLEGSKTCIAAHVKKNYAIVIAPMLMSDSTELLMIQNLFLYHTGASNAISMQNDVGVKNLKS